MYNRHTTVRPHERMFVTRLNCIWHVLEPLLAVSSYEKHKTFVFQCVTAFQPSLSYPHYQPQQKDRLIRNIYLTKLDCNLVGSLTIYYNKLRRPSKVHSNHFARHTSVEVIRPRLHHGEPLG